MSRLGKYFTAALCCVGVVVQAQVTFTGTTTDDAFLATGSPNNSIGADLTADNFGRAGVLAIAPASATNGEFQSVLKFDVSGATSRFNSTYGTNWIVTSISLDFASNAGTQGAQPMNGGFNPVNAGKFGIEWMADDDWVEGTGRPMGPTMDGVTYDSLSNLLMEAHVPLCTNMYAPPGDNVHVMWPLPLHTNLVSDVVGGGSVSFRLYAADNRVSYIFNSHNFGNGNEPLIHITAIPILKILSANYVGGHFHLAAIGATNAAYQVQATTNLSPADWQNVGAANADDTGAIQFDDLAAGYGRRYYRLSN